MRVCVCVKRVMHNNIWTRLGLHQEYLLVNLQTDGNRNSGASKKWGCYSFERVYWGGNWMEWCVGIPSISVCRFTRNWAFVDLWSRENKKWKVDGSSEMSTGAWWVSGDLSGWLSDSWDVQECGDWSERDSVWTDIDTAEKCWENGGWDGCAAQSVLGGAKATGSELL